MTALAPEIGRMASSTSSRSPTALPRALGRYELIAEIATGGMGVVCLGRSRGIGGFRRLCAIKVLHPHLAENPALVAMFMDEARLSARIHHPNVVATVDVASAEAGYFLVMDYVEGFPLLEVLGHPHIGRHQRIRLTIRVLLDAMAGLDAAHDVTNEEGVPLDLVHRDISPENLLVGLDGVGRVMDFGIARATMRIGVTSPGTVKGKPSYMSPEQALGQVVDRRADIWALGVVLWEALAGRQLFFAKNEAAMLMQVVRQTVESPKDFEPSLPDALVAVCLRALERDLSLRYEDVRELAADLERAASGAGLLADTREVSDCLQRVFVREIERRRAALRFYGEELRPGSLPMVARDLYGLPKLAEAMYGLPLTPSRPPEPRARSGPAPRLVPRLAAKPSAVQGRGHAIAPPRATTASPSRRQGPVFWGVATLAGVALGWLLTLPRFTNDLAVAAPAPPVVETAPPAVTASSPPSAAPSVLAAAASVQPLPPVRKPRARRAVPTTPKVAIDPAPSLEENPYRLR
jgi:eukaryotic-like serine/threonine-protein kinase